jgi:hypothetical protein
MASIVITINTDGAAFHGGTPDHRAVSEEVVRVLREIAEDFEFDGADPEPPRPGIRQISDTHDDPCGNVETID